MKNYALLLITLLVLSHSKSFAQWSLTGNAGTSATTNFIGTTDAKNFKIRTNNAIRVNITSDGKIGIGNFAPIYKLDVKGGSINTDSVYRIGGKTVLSVKGMQNVFAGAFCGGANTTGESNTGIGSGALYTNTEGTYNTATGADALFTNSLGNFNTAIGRATLFSNISGSLNTACGSGALYANAVGYQNAAFGASALNTNSGGVENTAIGSYSLNNNLDGASNSAVGGHSLSANTSGSNNTSIGNYSNVSAGTFSYSTVIGSAAVVNSSDKVRIGDAGITVVEGQVAYSWPSDARFKENVKEDVKGLDFILKLQPVSYNFNRLKYAQHVKQQLTPERTQKLTEQSQIRSVGFIAQDLEKIIQQTGFTAFDAVHSPTNESDNYSVGYAEFVVPLVKAVQELNEELKTEIGNLKSEVENLKSEVRRMQSQGSIEKPEPVQLFQNSPNPFSSASEIKFQLPAQFKSAQMLIKDENGKQLKAYSLHSSPLIINAGVLSAGIYTYSLVIDGLSVDTKQMIVTK